MKKLALALAVLLITLLQATAAHADDGNTSSPPAAPVQPPPHLAPLPHWGPTDIPPIKVRPHQRKVVIRYKCQSVVTRRFVMVESGGARMWKLRSKSVRWRADVCKPRHGDRVAR